MRWFDYHRLFHRLHWAKCGKHQKVIVSKVRHMTAELEPLFGHVLAESDNLKIVGAYPRRFEDCPWATVWPRSGLIRWQDGTIEGETLWADNNLADCADYSSRWSWFPRRLNGRFFNLSLYWWSNYYHWFCDVLPRLHQLTDRLQSDVQVISPALSPYQAESLTLVGVALSRCLTYTDRRPWKVERLLYASPVAMTGDHEPKSLSWMRDKIRLSILKHSDDRLGRRRLYVTRCRAACRRIVNEAELQPILDDYGFETVECEILSFAEQVRLFSEASIVVGSHGGGLTNILWCGRGASVFDIQQPHAVRRCYWSLARALGHHYFCAIGEAQKVVRGEPNIRVDPDRFRRALTTVLNGA
jgi:Capsular polysaccharide biosynthesis protein